MARLQGACAAAPVPPAAPRALALARPPPVIPALRARGFALGGPPARLDASGGRRALCSSALLSVRARVRKLPASWRAPPPPPPPPPLLRPSHQNRIADQEARVGAWRQRQKQIVYEETAAEEAAAAATNKAAVLAAAAAEADTLLAGAALGAAQQADDGSAVR